MTRRPSNPHAALAYANAGWSVFPCFHMRGGRCSCGLPVGRPDCSPGKHPRIKGGPNRASRNEATIRRWWERSPDANIGGTCRGLVVVDMDVRDGKRGLETLAALERKHGPLRTDLVQRSGSGGRHYIFRAREGVRYPYKLGPGIELLSGPGRYVLLAPSNHASGGTYRWQRGDGANPTTVDLLPFAPPWLETGLRAGRRAPNDLSTIAAMRPCGFTDKQVKVILGHLGFEEWCEDRDGWLRVGQALHHEYEGSADGLALWDWFSEISDKFDPDDSERVWRSFGPKATPLRLPTLLLEARRSRRWSESRFRAAGGPAPLQPPSLRSLVKPWHLRKGSWR